MIKDRQSPRLTVAYLFLSVLVCSYLAIYITKYCFIYHICRYCSIVTIEFCNKVQVGLSSVSLCEAMVWEQSKLLDVSNVLLLYLNKQNMISYSVIEHLLFGRDMIKSEDFGFSYSPIGLSGRLMAHMLLEIIRLRRMVSLLYRAWKEDYTSLTLAVSLSHIHLTLTFAFHVCIE